MSNHRNEAIRQLVRAGRRQVDVAAMYGISAQRVGRIVNGTQERPRALKPLRIYFLRAGDFIKIGITADLDRRLSIIRAACPIEVKLLATMAGHRVAEKELHERFAQHHYRNEWFYADAVIVVWIAENAISSGDQKTDLIDRSGRA